MAEPERFGLIYAVSGADEPFAEDGLFGFSSAQAGEFDNRFTGVVKCRKYQR